MSEEEYKALRRDYGICQECKKKDKIVHADIVVKINAEKDLELDNLISLCNKCADKKIIKETKIKKNKKNGTIKNMS
jgi:5-methylcytosine-specific restriction endonuclease McrA